MSTTVDHYRTIRLSTQSQPNTNMLIYLPVIQDIYCLGGISVYVTSQFCLPGTQLESTVLYYYIH